MSMSTAVEQTLAAPDKLMVEVFSVADLSVEDRVKRIWRAFDTHATLRPLKVGPGDPPRIKVGDSMEGALKAMHLPFDWWLTVRQSKPVYEGGDLKLYLGCGNWWPHRPYTKGDGRWDPHQVTMSWSAEWIKDNGGEHEAALVFVDLCDAMGACHGMLYQVHQAGQWMGFTGRARYGPGDLERELRDVAWLNYFGPAFVDRFPNLAKVVGARRMSSGGVVVQTASRPWMYDPNATSPDSYAWKHPLYEVLGRDSFVTPGVAAAEKPPGHLPSLREHMAKTAGTDEVPQQRWEREQAAYDHEKEMQRRARRFEKAKRALDASAPGAAQRAGRLEWSASFDTENLKVFWRRLTRRFKGDLAGERGKAMLAAIVSAPLDSEEEWDLALEGANGLELVKIGWFLDDLFSPDIYIYGSEVLIAEVDRVYEAS